MTKAEKQRLEELLSDQPGDAIEVFEVEEVDFRATAEEEEEEGQENAGSMALCPVLANNASSAAFGLTKQDSERLRELNRFAFKKLIIKFRSFSISPVSWRHFLP